jgi:hypothetical protein
MQPPLQGNCLVDPLVRLDANAKLAITQSLFYLDRCDDSVSVGHLSIY